MQKGTLFILLHPLHSDNAGNVILLRRRHETVGTSIWKVSQILKPSKQRGSNMGNYWTKTLPSSWAAFAEPQVNKPIGLSQI